MRLAGCFQNASRFVDQIEARVAIGLQRPGELAQVRLRMFAFAIRRVGERTNPRRMSVTPATIQMRVPPARSFQQLLQHHTQCFRIHTPGHTKMSLEKFRVNRARCFGGSMCSLPLDRAMHFSCPRSSHMHRQLVRRLRMPLT